MSTLNLTTDLDNKQTFTVNVEFSKVSRVCILRKYKDQPLIQVTQGSTKLHDSPTIAEIQDRLRLNLMTPLIDGEVVTVDGKQYALRVRGNYSDLGYLAPL